MLVKTLSHYYFCPENVVCFLHLLHLRLDFLKANNLNPDLTAPSKAHIVYNVGHQRTEADKMSRQQKS